MKTLRQWQNRIGSWARMKGWDDKERKFDEWIALFHTELSEAYEEYRNGHGLTEVYYNEDGSNPTKPEGIPIELADELIRILHFANKYGIDLDKMIELKMEYNDSRPYRHGGKVS